MDWYGQVRNCAGLSLSLLLSVCVVTELNAQATETPAAPAQATAETAGGAASPIKLEEAGISLAPADVAFFSATLNLRESWQQQVETGWVAEVRRVPYVRQLEQFLQDQWDNPQPQTEQVKTFLSSPIVRDIVNLLRDMASRDCFVYGEHDWCDFLKGMSALQYEMAQLAATDEEAFREYFLGLDKADIDAIPIPTTIIGFQLSDQENARTQLDAFEGILRLALGNFEPLKPLAKGLRRKDLANGQILSMTLSANDVPWQDLPATSDEATEAIEHASELLKDRKIVVSLGVISNRLLIGVSETAETLLKLGTSDETLLTTDALKPLVSNNDKSNSLRGINYVSGDWRNAVWESNFGNYFSRLAAQISAAIASEADNPEDLEDFQEQLLEDCQWLDERIAEMIPEYADALAYSFKSSQGIEAYGYDWTPSWLLENAKPLAVASHGGTRPLLLIATRQQWQEGVDEIVEGILDAVPGYVDQLIEAGVIPEDEAEKAQTIVEGVFPILEDMFATMRDKIVPALDGNESLMSITALTTATQLGEDAPPPPEALPLPEIGIVMKLKNQDQFLSGCEDIIQSINSLIDFIREQDEDAVPDELRIPAPDEESLPGDGTRYSYPTSAPAPFDQFQLQMAINEEVAVLGYSTRQVRDLYQKRPLVARPAWYSPDKPTAAVGFIDVAGIFRTLRPWVHYGLVSTGAEMDQPLAPGQDGAPVPSGSDILQIWDTFKKFGKCAGTTVIDKDDVTVSHWIWIGE